MINRTVPPIERCLSEETREKYREFLSEYRAIRKREGRGSIDPEFYLRLPEGEFTGHRAKEWKLRAQSLFWLRKHLAGREHTLSILDAGAGNCWLTRYLAEWGHVAVALDLNDDPEDGLAAGRYYLERLSIEFRRIVADYAKLPFQTASFDVVVYNGAIHYAEGLREVIGEGARCLKAGGELIIVDTPFYSNSSSGEKMLAERKTRGLAGYLTFQSLESVCADVGLDVCYNRRPSSPLQRLKRRLSELARGREFASMPWVILRKTD